MSGFDANRSFWGAEEISSCPACGQLTDRAYCGRPDCPGPRGDCSEGHYWVVVPETKDLKNGKPMVRCLRQGCDAVGWDV